jgi:hypothetical protein
VPGVHSAVITVVVTSALVGTFIVTPCVMAVLVPTGFIPASIVTAKTVGSLGFLLDHGLFFAVDITQLLFLVR